MTELISIATATAHPGGLDDLVRELRARIEPTRAQPGNLEFTLYREADAPDTIVAYERWATRAVPRSRSSRCGGWGSARPGAVRE